MARALGLPLAETARYWQAERGSLQRGLSALGLGLVATLAAGVVLGTATGRLRDLPGLVLIIPAAIGMRGNNFGALAARLSTGIHTGQFERDLTRPSFLGQQIEAAIVLSVVTTAEIAVLAELVAAVLGLRIISVWQLAAISVVGGMLSSLLLLGVTVALAWMASQRAWNMDDVGAPAITAAGDLITLPSLLAASLLVGLPVVSTGIGVLSLLAGGLALWHGWSHPAGQVRQVVRESAVVLTLAATVDVFAGILVEGRIEQFLDIPALLVLIPPFIATCGSLGGILASRLSSKLHLGLLEPRVVPGKLAWLDVSLVFLFAAAAFAGVGVVTRVAAGVVGLDSPGVAQLLGITLLAGALAVVLLSTVAYTAATATYRFGLDPDNHGIPAVTASMDLLGVVCLVAAIAVLGTG